MCVYNIAVTVYIVRIQMCGFEFDKGIYYIYAHTVLAH